MFVTLAGGEKITKLDLAHAYQLLADKNSWKLLAVNTHKGLFEPTILQFGVHLASGVFQRKTERLIGIPFTKIRVDDILVSGCCDAEHFENLRQVLMVNQ